MWRRQASHLSPSVLGRITRTCARSRAVYGAPLVTDFHLDAEPTEPYLHQEVHEGSRRTFLLSVQSGVEVESAIGFRRPQCGFRAIAMALLTGVRQARSLTPPEV